MSGVYLATAAVLVALGMYGMFANAELLRRIIAANVLSSGVFLFIVAASSRPGQAHADPVAQALVLTGIVVAVSVTALALALLRRLADATGETVLPEDEHG